MFKLHQFAVDLLYHMHGNQVIFEATVLLYLFFDGLHKMIELVCAGVLVEVYCTLNVAQKCSLK